MDLGGTPGWFNGNVADAGTTAGVAATLYQGPIYAWSTYTVDETTLYTVLDDGDAPGIVPDPAEPKRRWIWRACALASCATTVRTIHEADSFVLNSPSLAVAGSELFFTINEDPNTSTIMVCPVTGCHGQPRRLSVAQSLTGLSVDDQYVYWLDDKAYSISRCSRAGGSVADSRSLAPSLPNEALQPPLVLAGQYLYWASSAWASSAKIHRMKADFTAEPEVFYDSQLPLAGLASASGGLYFGIATLSGEVRRCPLTRCPSDPEVVATAQRHPMGLAADDRSLYWFSVGAFSANEQQVSVVAFWPAATVGRGDRWAIVRRCKDRPSRRTRWADRARSCSTAK